MPTKAPPARRHNAPAPAPDMSIVERDEEYPTVAGCTSLLAAMWALTREDFVSGWGDALKWLHSPAFEKWAALSFPTTDTEIIRRHLLSVYRTGRRPRR